MNSRALAGLLAGTLLAGALMGRVSAGGGAEATAPKPAGPGPRQVVAGVGVGWERSREGAVGAALAYEVALERVGLASEAERRAVLDAITTPARRDQIREAMEPGLRVVKERLGTEGVLRGAMVGYRLKGYDADGAEVETWGAGIIGAPQLGSPQVAWTTSTLRLRWVENDWKLADAPESKTGPTPQQHDLPSDPSQVLAALRNLEEVAYGPR